MTRARRDLSGIHDWIGARSSDTALCWYVGLRAAIRMLGNKPHRCPVTTEDRHLRHLFYGHRPDMYRVIYRVLENQKEVHVLHIRHGARPAFTRDDLT